MFYTSTTSRYTPTRNKLTMTHQTTSALTLGRCCNVESLTTPLVFFLFFFWFLFQQKMQLSFIVTNRGCNDPDSLYQVHLFCPINQTFNPLTPGEIITALVKDKGNGSQRLLNYPD